MGVDGCPGLFWNMGLGCLEMLPCPLLLSSVRINERRQRGLEESKRLAYLIDIKTIAAGEQCRCV